MHHYCTSRTWQRPGVHTPLPHFCNVIYDIAELEGRVHTSTLDIRIYISDYKQTNRVYEAVVKIVL